MEIKMFSSMIFFNRMWEMMEHIHGD
jgi:hypothetical protein